MGGGVAPPPPPPPPEVTEWVGNDEFWWLVNWKVTEVGERERGVCTLEKVSFLFLWMEWHSAAQRPVGQGAR